MVFSSLIFIFVFLPITLGLYYLAPKIVKNSVLLLASLTFYLWGEMGYIVVMILSILVNYLFGVCLSMQSTHSLRRLTVICGVVFNIGVLIYYKYANFLVDSLADFPVFTKYFSTSIDSIHLPIGISFFTFQALSYVVDVYRYSTPAQKNIFSLGLYIASFPQLIAGPIVRYHDIAQQLKNRTHHYVVFASGVKRFIIGLGKKVLIANVMAEMADQIFALPANELSSQEAWLGLTCYTLQIYFDFSGYSDMAIGLGRMFGFQFLENFNFPYISRSIQEFWRRWHISLSSWFRDYLYIPLGGNRKGLIRTYVNLLIVFALCGFWHGASWNFLIWGLIHGFFLVIEKTRFGHYISSSLPLIRHIYVILVVMLAWVFFRVETLPEAINYLGALFGLTADAVLHPAVINKMDYQLFVILFIGVLLSTPIYPKLTQAIRNAQARSQSILSSGKIDVAINVAHVSVLLTIFGLAILSLAAGTYNPFIYFRF